MKKIGLLITLILLIQFCYSQSFKSLLKQADKAFDAKDYLTATELYSKAYEQNPINLVKYKWALSKYEMRNYKESLKMFKNIRKESVEKFPFINYYIAMNYKSLGEYKKAIRYFKRYYKKHRKVKDYHTIKSKHEMASCEKALNNSLEVDSSINIYQLQIINTEEFSTLQYNILDNGDTLLISKHPLNKRDSLYTARLFQLKNGKLKALNENINQAYHQIGSFCNPSGSNELYLSVCVWVNGKKDCSIYKSERIGKSWSSIQKLTAPVNIEDANNIHPFVFTQNDKTYLLFSSDREGSKGGFDLYYSELKNGQFSKVKHFGNRINSIENEITPSYDIEDQKLYFSSQWFNNNGGYDIFYASGIFPNLETPENMGVPINSSYDDVYYTWSNYSDQAYFSSNRIKPEAEEASTCCNQIYTYPLFEKVPDTNIITKKINEMEQLVPINLYFDNDQPNPKTNATTTNFTYEETYNQYFTRISKYEKAYSKGLKGEEKEAAKNLIDDFFYEKLETGFDDLKTFNIALLKILKEGYDVKLIIKGYSSSLNHSQYNLNLSKRRIQSIINYYRQVDDNIFNSYIENKKLLIEEEAFGDSEAIGNVSDDRNDKRNSVYSPAAAKARKVKILAFKLNK